MEGGGLDRRRFMEEIRAYTTDIVENAKNFQGDTIEGNFEDIDVTCPACKTGTIHDTGNPMGTQRRSLFLSSSDMAVEDRTNARAAFGSFLFQPIIIRDNENLR